MTNIRNIFMQTLRMIWAAWPLIILLAVLHFFLFDNDMWCLDHKMIYDPVQKICRDDCLTWDDKTGCVPLTVKSTEN